MKKQIEHKVIILPTELVNKIEVLRSILPEKAMDKIYTFLNKLQYSYYFNKKNFVIYHNISSDYLDNLFGKTKIDDNYKRYSYFLNLLEENKIIKINNSYSNLENNSFSKSYSLNYFCNLYKNNLLDFYSLLNYKLNYNILYNNISSPLSTSYVWKLENTPFSLVKVDKKIYSSVSEKNKKKYEEVDKLIVEEQTNILKNNTELLIPKEMEVSIFQYEFIEKIKRKNIFVYQDTFSGRLHSNITQIRSEYREFLYIDGEETIEIDIKNAQSVFLATIIKRKLGKNTDANQDQFIDEAYKGKLYDHITDYIIKKHNDTRKYETIREEVKLNIQKLYFSDDYKHISKFHKLFKDMFPSVLTFINTWKSVSNTGGREFAALLQSAEKIMVLNTILPKAYELGLKVLTIHDSFIIKKSDINKLLEIILEENLPIKIKENNNKQTQTEYNMKNLVQTKTMKDVEPIVEEEIIYDFERLRKIFSDGEEDKTNLDEELSDVDKILQRIYDEDINEEI